MSASSSMTSPSGTAGHRGRRVVDACRDEFTLVVEAGKPKMQCNHCSVVISNHTVTLKNHLARKHGVGAVAAAAPAANGAAAAAAGGGASAPADAAADAQPAADDDSGTPRKRARRSDNTDEQPLQQQRESQAAAELANGGKRRRLAEVAAEVEVEVTGGPHEGASDTASEADEADEELVPLLDHQEFVDMNREMHEVDEMREQIIKRSREILKCSKQAIFALHRNDNTGAGELLAKAETVIPELFELATENPSLRVGSLSAALEEYVEAKTFSFYLTDHRLLPLRDLPHVQKSEYIGGIIDLTGELMRYAVVKATERDIAEVKRCRAMVEAISGELIQFDFGNGPLRKKYDSVKYNLRKLENTLYELSLITNAGLAIRSDAVQDDPKDDSAAEP